VQVLPKATLLHATANMPNRQDLLPFVASRQSHPLLLFSCFQQVQALPKATLLLATAKAPNRQDLLRYLAIWAPGNAAQGLQLLCGPAAEDPAMRSYAIKCLFNERPEKVWRRLLGLSLLITYVLAGQLL
jgi:hypothetical protein